MQRNRNDFGIRRRNWNRGRRQPASSAIAAPEGNDEANDRHQAQQEDERRKAEWRYARKIRESPDLDLQFARHALETPDRLPKPRGARAHQDGRQPAQTHAAMAPPTPADKGDPEQVAAQESGQMLADAPSTLARRGIPDRPKTRLNQPPASSARPSGSRRSRSAPAKAVTLASRASSSTAHPAAKATIELRRGHKTGRGDDQAKPAARSATPPTRAGPRPEPLPPQPERGPVAAATPAGRRWTIICQTNRHEVSSRRQHDICGHQDRRGPPALHNPCVSGLVFREPAAIILAMREITGWRLLLLHVPWSRVCHRHGRHQPFGSHLSMIFPVRLFFFTSTALVFWLQVRTRASCRVFEPTAGGRSRPGRCRPRYSRPAPP